MHNPVRRLIVVAVNTLQVASTFVVVCCSFACSADAFMWVGWAWRPASAPKADALRSCVAREAALRPVLVDGLASAETCVIDCARVAAVKSAALGAINQEGSIGNVSSTSSSAVVLDSLGFFVGVLLCRFVARVLLCSVAAPAQLIVCCVYIRSCLFYGPACRDMCRMVQVVPSDVTVVTRRVSSYLCAPVIL